MQLNNYMRLRAVCQLKGPVGWKKPSPIPPLRALALYSMVDESSDMLESGLTRKKQLAIKNFFYFLLRHALKLLLKHVLLQVKIMLKIPQILPNSWIFNFYFFLSSDLILPAYFIFYFFLSNEPENPLSESVNHRI